jgi:hypothetical protein
MIVGHGEENMKVILIGLVLFLITGGSIFAQQIDNINDSSTNLPMQEQNTNYSIGFKLGMGVLNLAFGLGSFIMGDVGGGFLVGGIHLTWILLPFIGEEMWLRGDDEAYNILTKTAEVAIACAVVVGFIRPFIYDENKTKRNGKFASLDKDNLNPMEHIALAPVINKNGVSGMALLFNVSY